MSYYRNTGNSEWLGYLLERYTTLLLGVAMKYLKDKIQAQDAVQQVFVKVLTSFPKEEILNFKGWLYILMRNHCLGQLRSASHHYTQELPEHILLADEYSKEELLDNEQVLQQLDMAIEMLNEEQKTAIRLFYLQKLTYKQIMERTSFTFDQVKSFVQNGKRNLKIALLKIRSVSK